MRGAGLVLRVHGIGEVDDLVGDQPYASGEDHGRLGQAAMLA